MITLQTNDVTGDVTIYPASVPPPRPKPGHTIRQVESIPTGPGKLIWLDGSLHRADPPPPPVPAELPTWAVLAICDLTPLGNSTLTHAINALIGDLEEPDKTIAKRVFGQGNFVSRASAILVQVTTALGLTAEQVDALFRAAVELQARAQAQAADTSPS